jgi:hypothetical protein
MTFPRCNTVLFTFVDMKCLIHFEFDLQGQTLIQAYVELLKVLRVAISGPEIGYWKETLELFSWFFYEIALASSKNKVCIKVTEISEYWRHPPQKELYLAYDYLFPISKWSLGLNWVSKITVSGEMYALLGIEISNYRLYVAVRNILILLISMYLCMYVCVCMYVCMYVCLYVCMYVRKYIRMYICTCMFLYMYVCIYVLVMFERGPFENFVDWRKFTTVLQKEAMTYSNL